MEESAVKTSRIVMLSFVVLLVVSACSTGPRQEIELKPETSATQNPSVAASDNSKDRIDNLAERLNAVEEYLERDPKYLIYVMDRDLDAVENGRETDVRGSFSDYFVPNAARALQAGVAKKDVTARIDRVIALAEQKKYLSSFVAELMDRGGPSAVRSYADNWIDDFNRK